VISSSTNDLKIHAKDIKGYKQINISDFKNFEFGREQETTRKVLLYHGISEVPLIARTNSNVIFSIPYEFKNQLDILIQEDNAHIDLRGIGANKVIINASYSQLSLILSEGKVRQKVTINGIESKVKIFIPEETTVELLHTNFSQNLDEDEKLFKYIEDNTYKHIGSSASSIDLELRVNKNLLEILPLSEHN
jgi:hypothetical protein